MYALRLLLTTLLSLTISTSAAPVDPRQIGNLACNVARIKIVAAFGSAGSAIDDIADPAVKTAAQAGLDQANGGIKTIASAILSGDAAPATARDEVAAGLAAMNTALAGADA